MDVGEIRERLAAMSLLIEGVRTAKARFPTTIQNAELPCMIVGVGDASYRRSGSIRTEERRYTLTLYVASVSSGIEAKAEEAAEAFLTRIADYFDARPGLELDTMRTSDIKANLALIMGDSGIESIEYPPRSGKYYIGVSFLLMVREEHHIRYRG